MRACVVVLISLLLPPQPALAAEPASAPWDGPAPLSVDAARMLAAAKAFPRRDTEPTEMLHRELVLRVDTTGSVATLYQVMRVGEGVPASEIQIGGHWDEGAGRPEFRARVILPDGTVRSFEDAAYIEQPREDGSIDLVTDVPIVSGAVLEQVMTVRRGPSPLPPAGTVALGPGFPSRLWRLRIEAPADLPLRAVARGIELAGRESKEGNSRRIVFEVRDAAPPAAAEPEHPPDVPDQPVVEYSVARSWAEVIGAAAAAIDGPIGTGGVDALVAGLDRRGELRPLLHEVFARCRQAVRQKGWTTVAGEVPGPPARTLEAAEGSVLDFTAVAVAALRALGLEAHVALASVEVDPLDEVPGLHGQYLPVVHLPGRDPAFVDPGWDETAFLGVPEKLQGRKAIVLARKGGGLVTLPTASAEANRLRVVREFRFAGPGPARATVDFEVFGLLAAALRTEVGKADGLIQALAESEARSCGGRVEDLRFEAGDPGGPFRMHVVVAEATHATLEADGRIQAKVFPKPLLYQLPLQGERKTDAWIPQLHQVELVTRVHQEGAKAGGFGRPQELVPFGPLVVERSYASPEGVNEMTLRLVVDRRRFTPAELRRMATQVRDFHSVLLFVKDGPGGAEAPAGRGATVAALRASADAAPKDASLRALYAEVLLRFGMVDEARGEAERAIALGPKVPTTHAALGRAYRRGTSGRLHADGWNRARAIAAFRSALELEPANDRYRVELAEVLLVDELGRPLGDAATRAAFVENYLLVRGDGTAHPSLERQLPEALLLLGRHRELRALFTGTKEPGLYWNAAIVAAAGAEGGPSAAMLEAEQLPLSVRGPVLARAALHLAVLRRYPEAVKLLEAVPADMRGRDEKIASLRATRRHEEVKLDPASPASVALDVGADLAAGRLGPKDATRLFARAAREGPAAYLDAEFFANSAVAAARKRDPAIGPEASRDEQLAFETTVEGDDRVGWRVELRCPAGCEEDEVVVRWVVREEGKYKLLYPQAGATQLAAEAWRRFAANDEAGGRRWIAWTRRELPADPSPYVHGATLKRLPDDAPAAALARAALLIAASSGDPELIDRVLDERKRAVTPEDAREVDAAIALIGLRQNRWDLLEAATGRLLAEDPASPEAFALRSFALRFLGREADAVAEANARLERNHRDGLALSTLLTLAADRGDLEQAERIGQAFIDSGAQRMHGETARAFLWATEPAAIAHGLEHARAAVKAGADDASAILAALLARAGQVEEAHRALVEPAPDEVSADGERFALGCIAEVLGLDERALAFYRQVGAAPSLSTASWRAIAAARIQAIEQRRGAAAAR